MKHWVRNWLGIIALLLPFMMLLGAPPGSAQNYVTDRMLLQAEQDPNNWLLYGRTYANTRFSPLTQINRSNVRKLVPKWVFQFGVVDGQEGQAIVNNGVLYITSAWNHLFALEAATGKLLWRYDHPLPADLPAHVCCDVVNRGVAVYHDKVYLATLDAHVVALDAKTGKVVWDKTVGDYTYSEVLTLMPLALRGKIIVGPAGAEYGIRGWILALNAETGEQVWKTYTIPGPGEPGNETWPGESWKYGGGSAWITGSYDPELNILYWPVGNPSPDFDRHVRLGDNLYTNSTLALDPDTGRILFYFQYTPNDPYDFDGVNEVVLADATIQGQPRKVWVHADRNGYFYVIDRTNGKFIYGVPFTDVNWAKGLDKNGRPIFNWPEKDVVHDRVTTDIRPAQMGGKNWHPIAYSPLTGYAYIPALQSSNDLQAARQEWKRGQLWLGLEMKTWGYQPGYGTLTAIDIASGKTAWVYNDRSPMYAGVLATAGGLVFIGNPEGEFLALDHKTGELLWKFRTGSGIVAPPTTFAVDGKQYIAVASGWGGWTGWATIGKGSAPWLRDLPKGGALFVFGLFDE